MATGAESCAGRGAAGDGVGSLCEGESAPWLARRAASAARSSYSRRLAASAAGNTWPSIALCHSAPPPPTGKPNRIGRLSTTCPARSVVDRGKMRQAARAHAKIAKGAKDTKRGLPGALRAPRAPGVSSLADFAMSLSALRRLDTEIALCYPPNVRIEGRRGDTNSPSPLKGLRAGCVTTRCDSQTALTQLSVQQESRRHRLFCCRSSTSGDCPRSPRLAISRRRPNCPARLVVSGLSRVAG